MRFPEMLEAGAFPVALEITPPRRPQPEVLLRRARLLGARPDVVNVIQREGRWSSLEACIALRRAGLEPIWHVAARGRGRGEVASDVARARGAGLRLALCLRGDHDAQDRPDTPRVREVVAMLREGLPDALLGATANQYGPRARVLANLLPKLAAGARFVQTNPTFELAPFLELADAVKSRVPEARLVPMAIPLLDAETAARIAGRLGIPLPRDLAARLRAGDAEAGWGAFAETLARLRESPLADGVAIMTPTMDAPPAVAARIVAALPARAAA